MAARPTSCMAAHETRDDATTGYHDAFTKWYRSRKNDTVYREIVAGEMVDACLIRKNFEANARATSTEWRRKVRSADVHLSARKKERIISTVLEGQCAIGRSTRCTPRQVTRAKLYTSARRVLGGTTADVIRQLCQFANGGRDGPLSVDSIYDTFAVSTGYRFLEYRERETGARAEAWPHLRSAVLACVAMQRGTVSDLVRHLQSVDELDAHFTAGKACGMVPLLTCTGNTNALPDEKLVGHMESAIAFLRQKTTCESKKAQIETVELLVHGAIDLRASCIGGKLCVDSARPV